MAQSIVGSPQLIVAREEQHEAQSDVTAATAAFLPAMQFLFEDQLYSPDNKLSPVVVIGNTVLGGAESKSAYGSLSLTWNLMDSGRDLAAYQAARAVTRAASSAVDSQISDTLTAVLQAFADLYESEVAAHAEADAITGLKAIQARAEDRYAKGQGTTVAIGQARAAAFDAEQSFARACHTMADKAAALAQAVGMHVPLEERLAVAGVLPMPTEGGVGDSSLESIVASDPAVVAAKEKIAAADGKRSQAIRAFGPSVSLAVRRDYLKQSEESFGNANQHIAPYDYQVGLYFQQPLFPLFSEAAGVSKAKAELRKAQAQYDQARLETEAKLRDALGARREMESSYAAARSSLQESQKVLSLTESLFRAGRTDLDNVEHARMDRDKALADVRTFESRRALAEWIAIRSLEPAQFSHLVLRHLNLWDATSARGSEASQEEGLP